MENLGVKKILVVEDDEAIMWSLQQLLELEGHEVFTAYNGHEALELLRKQENSPTLIILDLMMPIMDGFEFREEQKNDPKLKHIPVIIMSADGHVERKKMQLNAEAYLRKPVDINVLLEMINKYVNGPSFGE